MKADNRKHKRRTIDGVIDFKIQDNRKSFEEVGLVTGTLENISKSGLGIRTMNPIDTGTPVIVKKVRIIREETRCDVFGIVAWIKATGDMYSIGSAFEKEVTQDLHPDLN